MFDGRSVTRVTHHRYLWVGVLTVGFSAYHTKLRSTSEVGLEETAVEKEIERQMAIVSDEVSLMCCVCTMLCAVQLSIPSDVLCVHLPNGCLVCKRPYLM